MGEDSPGARFRVPWGGFPWGVVRVRGESMRPVLHPGEFALYRRLRPSDPVAQGTVVLADHAELGLILKRVAGTDTDGRYRLNGTSVLSSDPERLGPLDASRLIGRVLAAISPDGIRRIRAR